MNESLIEDAFLNPALIHTQWHSLRNKLLLTCCPSLPFSQAIRSPVPLPPPLPPPPPPVPSQLPFYNTIQWIRKWDTVCFNAFWSELLKGPSLVKPIKRYWNLVLKCNGICFESCTSPPPSPPRTPLSSHHLRLYCLHHLCYLHLCKKKYCINSFSCTFYSMRIFLNLTADIMILGTYTHFS